MAKSIFVAYLLPQVIDVQLEDGIQWMAKGETKEEAEQALRYLFEATMRVEHYSEEEAETIWNQHDSYTRIV